MLWLEDDHTYTWVGLRSKAILLRSSCSFPILEKTGKGWSGEGRQKLYENTNPNMVEYKGLVGAVTSGATTAIRGIGRKLR
jgi:hypothetical protein